MSEYDRLRHKVTLRPGSPLLWVLQRPLVRTEDRPRALRSRLTWGAEWVETFDPATGGTRGRYVFTLTPLGILNGLFGLYVHVPEESP